MACNFTIFSIQNFLMGSGGGDSGNCPNVPIPICPPGNYTLVSNVQNGCIISYNCVLVSNSVDSFISPINLSGRAGTLFFPDSGIYISQFCSNLPFTNLTPLIPTNFNSSGRAGTLFFPDSGLINSLSCSQDLKLMFSDIQIDSFRVASNIVSGVSSYRLDISTGSSFSDFIPSFNNYNWTNINTPKYIGNLKDETTYYVRLRALNNTGMLLHSGISSITTPVRVAYPYPLSGNNIGLSGFTLIWNTGGYYSYPLKADQFDIEIIADPKEDWSNTLRCNPQGGNAAPCPYENGGYPFPWVPNGSQYVKHYGNPFAPGGSLRYSVSGNLTSIPITGLPIPGGTYFIKMRSWNQKNNAYSNFSPSLKINILPPIPVLNTGVASLNTVNMTQSVPIVTLVSGLPLSFYSGKANDTAYCAECGLFAEISEDPNFSNIITNGLLKNTYDRFAPKRQSIDREFEFSLIAPKPTTNYYIRAAYVQSDGKMPSQSQVFPYSWTNVSYIYTGEYSNTITIRTLPDSFYGFIPINNTSLYESKDLPCAASTGINGGANVIIVGNPYSNLVGNGEAIRGPGYSNIITNLQNPGSVTIYTGSGQSWNLSQRITGSNFRGKFGEAVAINSSGTIIAIAEPTQRCVSYGNPTCVEDYEPRSSGDGRIFIYTGIPSLGIWKLHQTVNIGYFETTYTQNIPQCSISQLQLTISKDSQTLILFGCRQSTSNEQAGVANTYTILRTHNLDNINYINFGTNSFYTGYLLEPIYTYTGTNPSFEIRKYADYYDQRNRIYFE